MLDPAEVVGEEAPAAEQVGGARLVVAEGDGVAFHQQAAAGVGGDADAGQGGADVVGVGAWGGGGVERDAAALAGAVEVVDLEAGGGVDPVLEFEREGGAGRDRGGDRRALEDAAAQPGAPDRGHRRHGQAAVRGERGGDGLRERDRQRVERHAVEEQRQHEVGKPVGMRERDHAQVRAVGREAHRGGQPVGLGDQLGGAEVDAARDPGGPGRGLDQHHARRRRHGEDRGGGAALDRDHRLAVAPRLQDREQEREVAGAGEHRPAGRGRGGGPRRERGERQVLAGGAVDHRDAVGVAAGGLEPARIEHGATGTGVG